MADFAPALAYLLPNEGGYVDNPNDIGGATNYGITQATLDAWNQSNAGYPASVADLTVDQAGDIYQTQYWPGLDAVNDQAVASKCLDIRVNFGLSGGTKLIQQAVNSIITPATAVDGNLGPDTVNSINAADPTAMLNALVSITTAHYQAIVASDPSQAGFLAGWLARAARLPALTLGTAGLIVLLLIGGFIWMMKKGQGV